MNKIFIVTGKIHSGKTTSLFNFINKNKNVDGILTPIIDNKRKLYHITSKTIKGFEVENDSKEIITVGKYCFLKSSFEWANQILIESFNKEPDWLVIDEVGKLELKENGFHKSVINILANIENRNSKIILVIRDSLLSDALEFYNIKENYKLLKL